MPKTDYNDLFKSELGSPADDHLVDCPHCEAPITKSDLAKAHGGAGKTTHLTGPKHGKSGAHVRDQNPEGGTMRGGEGRGVLASSRGVPGAEKVDEVLVQSTDRHKRKNAAAHQANTPSKKIPHLEKAAYADMSSDDHESDDETDKGDPDSGGEMEKAIDNSKHTHILSGRLVQGGSRGYTSGQAARTARDKLDLKHGSAVHTVAINHNYTGTAKSVTIRGTEHVMWVDDGSDAALAKSIAEGALGGTPPTQPLDLNNDLTRLLI